MPTIRVSASEDPSWEAMTDTSLLTDGSEGDTITGEASSDFESIGASAVCLVRIPECFLTAEFRYTTEQILSEWRVTGALSLALAQSQAICVPDEETDYPTVGGSASIKLYAWVSSSWVLVDTYSPVVPVLVYEDESEEVFTSGAMGADETTSCRFRIVVEYAYTWVGSNNTISIGSYLSDVRFTVENTDTLCEEDGGGVDPQPPPDACGCDWDEASPIVTMWAETSPVTTTHTEAAPLTSSFTRRACP